MIVQLLVARVHHHRSAGGRLEFGGASDVIDMGVRDHDGLHAQSVPPQHTENFVDVVAGIDDDGFLGLLVSENRAIALQHPDAKDFMNHDSCPHC